MLKSLHLENFKAFGNRAIIPMAPITLIFGQNSSGKSSILQALSLLKQTFESNEPNVVLLPRSRDGYVDLGSFQEMLFDHDKKRKMKIRIKFDANLGPPLVPLTINGKKVYRPRFGGPDMKGIELQYRYIKGSVELERLEIIDPNIDEDNSVISFAAIQDRKKVRDMGILTEEDVQFISITDRMFFPSDNEMFEYVQNRILMYCTEITRSKKFWSKLVDVLHQKENNIFLQSVGRKGVEELLGVEDTEFANKMLDSEIDVEEFIDWLCKRVSNMPVRTNLFSPPRLNFDNTDIVERATERFEFLPVRLLGENMIRNISRDISELLKRLHPLKPLRKSPSRWYVHSGFAPSSVGLEGELLPDLLYRNNALLEDVNMWLQHLDIGYEIDVVPIDSISDFFTIRVRDLRRFDSEINVNLSDIGYGVSQLLPFIVQSLVAKGQIISIEQPEVHIHPRLQADLGDLLIESTIRRGNQILIETHSEHLILRLMRRIREGKLNKDNVSIIYVRRGEQGSHVHSLLLDEEGDFIDEWPDGFFPERINELL